MKKWDISGTTRPIRLKFWEQVVETVPLVTYEVHLPQNPSHSTGKQVSNLNGSVQHSRRSPVLDNPYQENSGAYQLPTTSKMWLQQPHKVTGMKANYSTDNFWPTSKMALEASDLIGSLSNGSRWKACPEEDYETTYDDLMDSSGATKALYYITLGTLAASAIRVSLNWV